LIFLRIQISAAILPTPAFLSWLFAFICTFLSHKLDFSNENDYHLIMFSSSPFQVHSDAQSAQTGVTPGLARSPSSAALLSEKLLRGQKQVEILHNGSLYKLQATKLGKLILTK
jgi:hemin uptake protein HemP